MSLPGSLELKALLRIDTDAEDVLLDDMLAQAQAMVEAFLDRPIAAESRTWYDVEARANGQTLRVPLTPVKRTSPAPVVTDVDGTAITGFRVNPTTGVLTVTEDSSASFTNGPFTVVATVGLAVLGTYEAVIEPVLARAILDLAADAWHRRNPAATMEAEGAGVLTQIAPNTGIPARIQQTLAPFKRVAL